MSIGKNAIKRVENNGYSNVQTSAPDMENSDVVPETPVKEKRAPAKKTAVKTEGKNGFERYAFGRELPYWLL